MLYLCIDSTSGAGPRPSDLDFPVREGGSLTPVPVLIGALKYEWYIKYNGCIRWIMRENKGVYYFHNYGPAFLSAFPTRFQSA